MDTELSLIDNIPVAIFALNKSDETLMLKKTMLFCCRWDCLHLQYPRHYVNNVFLFHLLSLFVLLLSVQLHWGGGGGWSQVKRLQISMVSFVFPCSMTKVNRGLCYCFGRCSTKRVTLLNLELTKDKMLKILLHFRQGHRPPCLQTRTSSWPEAWNSSSQSQDQGPVFI